MAKLFSNILFSFFLLFHTTVIADEENASTEVVEEIEGNEASQSTEEEHNDVQEQEEKEAQEQLSELEKEALAAEEAELREAGMYDEPIPE
jgi:nucleosome binding factor SPN SPT16 subunit